MTTATTTPTTARPRIATAPLRRAFTFELRKLVAQWRVRVLMVLALLGPALFVAVVGRQSSLPADTVFGRWMGQSGWAGSLVVLSFCGSWVLPLLTSLVAGDVFASEDRLGTWRHLLVSVRSPRRIFATKVLAALTVVALLVIALALSATAGGLLTQPARTLVGLDGHLLSGGAAGQAVALSWVCVLAPTLAFAAVGFLGSVLFGRSPMGLLTPALLAVLLDVAQLTPLPTAVRVALPSYSFIAWRGLFTQPAQSPPIAAATAVSLAWAVVATAVAYWLFLRRDFTDLAHDGLGPRGVALAVAPLVGVLALSVAGVAATTSTSGSGIDRTDVNASVATSFAHLYRMQTAELHRPDVTEGQLRTTAYCNKGGGPAVGDRGAGNDWRCVVRWHIPGATATGSAIYQLDLTPDGRYVADGDGPQAVNGFFLLHTTSGDAPNPLWQFDGLVDLIHH